MVISISDMQKVINSLRKQDIKINVFDLNELIEIPSFKFKSVKNKIFQNRLELLRQCVVIF